MSRWTAEEDETIAKLAGEGLSASLIARAMSGRSERAVTSRLVRLGVSLRSREHQSLIEHLREGGKIVREWTMAWEADNIVGSYYRSNQWYLWCGVSRKIVLYL